MKYTIIPIRVKTVFLNIFFLTWIFLFLLNWTHTVYILLSFSKGWLKIVLSKYKNVILLFIFEVCIFMEMLLIISLFDHVLVC